MNERITEAIIRAMLRRMSYVIRYGDIEDELRKLATSKDEFEKLRHELDDNINPIVARGKYDTCYIYRIYDDEESRRNDVIVVVPFCLGDEFEKPTLEELGRLYENKRRELHEALDSVINELIKVWARDVDAPVDVSDAVSLLRKKLIGTVSIE
jgi:hypothetical protein